MVNRTPKTTRPPLSIPSTSLDQAQATIEAFDLEAFRDRIRALGLKGKPAKPSRTPTALPQASGPQENAVSSTEPSHIFEQAIIEKKEYEEAFLAIAAILKILENPELAIKLDIDQGNLIRGFNNIATGLIGHKLTPKEYEEMTDGSLRPRVVMHEKLLNLTDERDPAKVGEKLEAMTSAYQALRSDGAEAVIAEVSRVLNTLHRGADLNDLKMPPRGEKFTLFKEAMKLPLKPTSGAVQQPAGSPKQANTIDYTALDVEMMSTPEMVILKKIQEAFKVKTGVEFDARYRDALFEGDSIQEVLKKISKAMGNESFGVTLFSALRSEHMLETLGQKLNVIDANALKAKMSEIHQKLTQLYPNLN